MFDSILSLTMMILPFRCGDVGFAAALGDFVLLFSFGELVSFLCAFFALDSLTLRTGLAMVVLLVMVF